MFPEREGALYSVIWGDADAGLGKAGVKSWPDQPEVIVLMMLVDAGKEWWKWQSVALDWCNYEYLTASRYGKRATLSVLLQALTVPY